MAGFYGSLDKMIKYVWILCCVSLTFVNGCFLFKPSSGGDSMQEEKLKYLKIEELHVGNGKQAEKGKKITVHYTGWLTNGTKFDSSKDRDEPFEFTYGAGQVIRGWDEGFEGMKEGGIRKLTISPEWAYGTRDLEIIPPNSTLIFEVELLKVAE